MEGTWKKSSYSQGADNACVEVTRDERGLLARDSKCPDGGTLSFAGASATAFLTAVKDGRFDS